MPFDFELITEKLQKAFKSIKSDDNLHHERVDKLIDFYKKTDPQTIEQKRNEGNHKWLAAKFLDNNATIYDPKQIPQDYRVIAVDGSHIDVDRHSPIKCVVLNIGTVIFTYGSNPSAILKSSPLTYIGDSELGKKVNIGSYVVREEDSIEIRDKSKQLAIIDIALASKEREAPEYIQMDEKNKKFKFVRVPKFEEVPYPIVMEPNLVVEYYSR